MYEMWIFVFIGCFFLLMIVIMHKYSWFLILLWESNYWIRARFENAFRIESLWYFTACSHSLPLSFTVMVWMVFALIRIYYLMDFVFEVFFFLYLISQYIVRNVIYTKFYSQCYYSMYSNAFTERFLAIFSHFIGERKAKKNPYHLKSFHILS